MSSAPSSDLALQVLRLEQRLESYQRLHEQELDDLRRALAQVKERVLSLAAPDTLPSSDAIDLPLRKS